MTSRRATEAPMGAPRRAESLGGDAVVAGEGTNEGSGCAPRGAGAEVLFGADGVGAEVAVGEAEDVLHVGAVPLEDGSPPGRARRRRRRSPRSARG